MVPAGGPILRADPAEYVTTIRADASHIITPPDPSEVKLAFGTTPNVLRQFTAFEGAILLADVVIRPHDFVLITIVLQTTSAAHDGRGISSQVILSIPAGTLGITGMVIIYTFNAETDIFVLVLLIHPL